MVWLIGVWLQAEGLLAAKHTELSSGKKHCAGLDPSCPATEPLDMHAQPSGPHCTELETMDLLIGMEDGWLFKDPVDPVALAIPDYFSIVKFPMDFTTIKAKLTSGAYAGELSSHSVQCGGWVAQCTLGVV